MWPDSDYLPNAVFKRLNRMQRAVRHSDSKEWICMTLVSDSDFYPTECRLCDFSGSTYEDYEQHMAEVHDE